MKHDVRVEKVVRRRKRGRERMVGRAVGKEDREFNREEKIKGGIVVVVAFICSGENCAVVGITSGEE